MITATTPTNGKTWRMTRGSRRSSSDHFRWLPVATRSPRREAQPVVEPRRWIWYWEGQPIVPGEGFKKRAEAKKPGRSRSPMHGRRRDE